jgi:hypothetical protein
MRSVIFILTSVALSFSSCVNKKIMVANPSDYKHYMLPDVVAKQQIPINQEINFWQEKLQKDTGSYVNKLELGRYYLSLFKVNGDVNVLMKGDSLLKAASAKLKNTNPEMLHSLSQNAITQHQFIQAEEYNKMAERNNADAFTISLLQFDALMELGKYGEAYKNLERIADKSSFDYLIRKAKLEDHKGDLDAAIQLMEMAFETIKGKKKSLYVWTRSNLADMYGHAGRIKESYDAYIDVLKKDSLNLYCLKGIAWIAFSYDNNTTEAKRILQYILSQTTMPDLKLMLADIAEKEGKEAEAIQLRNDFVTTVSKPGYGNMYNKYLVELYSENLNDNEAALKLSEQEMKNRFTPETCDIAAWAYFNSGNHDKAFELSKNFVLNKTFEPSAMMHTAFIYEAKGQKQIAKKLLTECLESSFELGPLAVEKIQARLKML